MNGATRDFSVVSPFPQRFPLLTALVATPSNVLALANISLIVFEE